MHGMLVLFRLFLRGSQLGWGLDCLWFTVNHCWAAAAAAAVSQTENNKQVEVWDFYQTFFFSPICFTKHWICDLGELEWVLS